MNVEILASGIEGCFELRPAHHHDNRGRFTKLFQRTTFKAHGLCADFPETYLSTSEPGVLRGLHFQRPPHDHVKVVTCVAGSVIDVVLDLRRESATYGQHRITVLNADDGHMIYIPRGLAHGFYVRKDATCAAKLLYALSTEYAPSYDCGLHWQSAGITWPITGDESPGEDPLVSLRDRAFESFATFNSPFDGPDWLYTREEYHPTRVSSREE